MNRFKFSYELTKSSSVTMPEPTPCIPRDRIIPIFVHDNFLRRLLFPPKKLLSKYISEGQTVADLGSGPGYFTIPIAQIVGKEGKVYAADFDKKSISVLEKKIEKEGYSDVIEARLTSASELGFIPDSSVDLVFANGLLCCMADHDGAISEIQRILKKNEPGKAYLSVTKRFLRKTDPRTVVVEEWDQLLRNGFEVLSDGEGLMSRWALVALGTKGDSQNMTRKSPGEKIKLSSSCCACNC